MKIQWHSVTWYSKLLAVTLFVVVFFLGYCLGRMSVQYLPENKVVNIEQKEIESSDAAELPTEKQQLCFYRKQVATTDAPYSAEENIVLNIDGDVVYGTKNGTQSGPGVSNGYQGDFSGILDSNGVMEVAYTYIVEGSQGRELEIYKLEETQISKMIWPLTEEKNILTPTREGEPRLVVYSKVSCS